MIILGPTEEQWLDLETALNTYDAARAHGPAPLATAYVVAAVRTMLDAHKASIAIHVIRDLRPR